MPKVHDTRKQRAQELLKRLERGPSLGSFTVPINHESQQEADRQMRIWLDSWIIPEVKRLVPELKEKKSHDR